MVYDDNERIIVSGGAQPHHWGKAAQSTGWPSFVVLGHMARPKDMARLWVLDSVCKNIYAIN